LPSGKRRYNDSLGPEQNDPARLLIDPFVSLPMASPWWNRSGIVIVSYQVPSSVFADNLSLPGRDRMDNFLKAHT
jgi:hypothetical protein